MTSALGLDIGGSTTRGRLVVDSEIVAQASAGSASVIAAGEDLALRNLTQVVGALREHHREPPDAVCAAAAGSATPMAREWLRTTLAALTGSPRVSVVDDVAVVLAAAGHTEGVAVICGTGSIVRVEGPHATARAGGWGYLLGDEGGGYSLVRGALRVLLCRRDAGTPTGPLDEALRRAGGHETLDAMLAALYADPRPERWAALAPAVLACPDPAVGELVTDGAAAIAATVASLVRRLDLERTPIVLAGGLVADAMVRGRLVAALAERLVGWPVETLREDPVAGAVALALRALARGDAVR